MTTDEWNGLEAGDILRHQGGVVLWEVERAREGDLLVTRVRALLEGFVPEASVVARLMGTEDACCWELVQKGRARGVNSA